MRCFCGGALYPAAIPLAAAGILVSVAGWSCERCGQEEINAAEARALLRLVHEPSLSVTVGTASARKPQPD